MTINNRGIKNSCSTIYQISIKANTENLWFREKPQLVKSHASTKTMINRIIASLISLRWTLGVAVLCHGCHWLQLSSASCNPINMYMYMYMNVSRLPPAAAIIRASFYPVNLFKMNGSGHDCHRLQPPSEQAETLAIKIYVCVMVATHKQSLKNWIYLAIGSRSVNKIELSLMI